jgi:hypothetical protein
MSTTRGARILVGAATLATSIILLGGCSSSGTVKGAADGGANPLTGGLTSSTTAPASGGSTSSSSDDSSSGGASSSSSSDDSSGGSSSGGLTGGGSDPGCQAAMSDLTSGSQALAKVGQDPAGALAGLKSIGDKMHADASKSPSHASVINKVGDDYINLANAAAARKSPDMSGLTNDVTALMTACSG